jgi:RNA polymerase sigma factor (sigma-70 family)
MDAEKLFLSHLSLIERIATFVCHRNRVTGAEAEDFASTVKLKLIEDDYAVIRKFEGRAQFTTYITTVIQRIFSDQRIRQWGKWRASAEAKRLGLTAMTLERLVHRDGYTFSEALQILTTGDGASCTGRELEDLYLKLPARSRRPMLVDEPIPDTASTDGELDVNELFDGERRASARKTNGVLDHAIAELDLQDRLILRLRFAEYLTVPQIAALTKVDSKKIYKRIDKILRRLRAELASNQIDGVEVDALINRGEFEFDFGLRPVKARGKRNLRPSLGRESRGFGSGAGRLIE